MIRSLRLRFFLITWPLVVAAVGFVALAFGRWTRVELEVLETVVARPDTTSLDEIAARATAAWTGADGLEGLRSTLPALAASWRPPVDLVVLDPAGDRVATTDPGVTPEPGGVGPDGVARFVRSRETDGTRETSEMALGGVPLRDPGDALLGTLYVLPAATGPPTRPVAELRADARRTLWTAFAVASAAAALAALLLSGPLVRQVRRLAGAAAAVRDGALETRVPEGGADELGRLERSFNAMAESLERADAHQRNLVSDVAHELRTPLTNVAGTLEAIEDGLVGADGPTLSSLREEVGLLTRLVEDLQELSLAESGQLPYEVQALDVVREVQAALASMSAASGGVALEGPSASTPRFVDADRDRLRQVLRNLLRNALTHTPPGGSVSVAIEPREAGVAVLVRDTGRGIPDRHLPLVWERFHRVDPSRGRGSGGMGLGLALVRQHVLAMGGRVGVESREGEGATFEVVLPHARREQPGTGFV